jgi:hypothetical protein
MRWWGSGRRCLLGHWCRVSIDSLHSPTWVGLPLDVLGPGRLRLLPLGLRDAAFDTEGGAVGARDAQGGGVASYLATVMR